MPGLNEQMTRPGDRRGRRRATPARSSPSCSPRSGCRAPTRPSASSSTSTSCPPSPTRRPRCAARRCCSPRSARTSARGSRSRSPTTHLFDDCEVVVTTTFHSQRLASCPMECRVAIAVVGRGRPPRRTGRRRRRPTAPATRSRRARHRARRRSACACPTSAAASAPRAARRAEDILRRLARARGRPPRAVDRDPQREHARARPRPRPAPGAHDRRRPRREAQGLPDGDPPGLGRLPRDRRDPADAHEDVRVRRRTRSRRSRPTRSRSSRTPRRSSAYRGAGRPEATQAIERTIDVFAAETGLDPAEVRRRNLIPADAFPYTTAERRAATTAATTSKALDLALEQRGLRSDCAPSSAAAREAGDASRWASACAPTSRSRAASPSPSGAAVEITDDGGATVRTGLGADRPGPPDGAGDARLRPPGIPMDKITVVHGDTDLVPRGTGTKGSRSLQHGGAAIDGAAIKVARQGQGAGRRRARGQPGRHPARQGPRRVPRRRRAGQGRVVGRARELARRRRPARRSSRSRRTSSRRRRRGRSAPTSPSSRSTPRPARSSSCGSCASTTAA